MTAQVLNGERVEDNKAEDESDASCHKLTGSLNLMESLSVAAAKQL
jgi:hypothetical protein